MSDQQNLRRLCAISIWLFAKPDWELDLEGRDADAEFLHDITDLGDELRERLQRVSAVTRSLLDDGWLEVDYSTRSFCTRM